MWQPRSLAVMGKYQMLLCHADLPLEALWQAFSERTGSPDEHPHDRRAHTPTVQSGARRVNADAILTQAAGIH